MINFVRNLYLGVQRNVKRSLLIFFTTYFFLWGIIEPIIGLAVQLEHDIWYYQSFIFLSMLASLLMVYPKRSISILLKNTNTIVTVKFGDLFRVDGVKCIPVSQYFFEGRAKELIPEKSLQGQLIEQFFPEDELDSYEKRIKKELESILSENQENTANTTEIKYPFGSTIRIKKGLEVFVLFALTRTENKKRKKEIEGNNCDLPILVNVLFTFWTKMKEIALGQIINIPLVGSGVSGVGLPPLKILELNLLIILEASKKNHISDKINIILHEDQFDQINLSLIEESWS